MTRILQANSLPLSSVYRSLLKAGVILLGGLCLAGLNSGSAHAATPDEVLKEIISKIKKEENTSPIVEYVDWTTAYQSAPAEQKAMMQIDSPEELKEFYREMLKNPSAMMRKHVAARMGEANPEHQAMIDATMQRMEAEMKKKEDEMRQRITGTEYTVGKSKVEGDEAIVELTTSYQGEEKTHDVNFVKSDNGKWLLASPGFAMESKAPAVAPGQGGLPQGHPPVGR